MLVAGLALMPVPAAAFDLEDALRAIEAKDVRDIPPEYRTTQGGDGKSLSEAIEQVRRQTGGQILSAKTKVSGNREVHHIKVLTKDGKVRTVKVQGRRRGG
jgi:uncharacterized membrane protein YkoI